ncbi:hypothetical protein DYBT9275_06009 [Dyadobacter sp. CECT 9275]|uniref:Signal transduction histidine kinase internal region domain-containing protein n=1 Tax=Dyadobacter helix TaxID=2822344 RepID=A0A916NEA8_9BACT|nr:histidine kinase [Dyadobacter sp. CECT 9275]CAG5018475.1 hypothetical protein DYBT9275_06009 [Dyadobacter sp. CECT 9275]
MNTKEIPDQDLNRKSIYLLLSAIASVPIWLAVDAYIRTIHVHEDEAVATAATGCFIAGVFMGRYLARLWAINRKNISSSALIGLFVLIVFSTAWLFFHADFPFETYGALNLLLYWVPFLLISLATGALIKLGWLVSQKQLREAQTSAAHSQSELQLLHSQLSPHFLFNTLNNLYGLSLTQHEKIPPLLLKLSDLLRYSVYDRNENFVLLKDELAYIHNYIDFEKIRIGERLRLTTDVENMDGTAIKIAPMLLIVFIENAFKHSKNTFDEKIYIDLSLKTWSNNILFSVKNSHGQLTGENNIIPKSSGLGLVNVRKRLELLYPGEHELTVTEEDTSYTVSLRLKMK